MILDQAKNGKNKVIKNMLRRFIHLNFFLKNVDFRLQFLRQIVQLPKIAFLRILAKHCVDFPTDWLTVDWLLATTATRFTICISRYSPSLVVTLYCKMIFFVQFLSIPIQPTQYISDYLIETAPLKYSCNILYHPKNLNIFKVFCLSVFLFKYYRSKGKTLLSVSLQSFNSCIILSIQPLLHEWQLL